MHQKLLTIIEHGVIFLKLNKELEDQDELYLSTNEGQPNVEHIYKPKMLRKSESVDGSVSPTCIDVMMIKSNLESKKLKIKSNKDLNNVRNSKSNNKVAK